jgi:hypothetical protein
MDTRELAVSCDPWPHLEIPDFLPTEMAREIADHWPKDGFRWLMHSDIRKPDGSSLRKYQPLEREFPEAAVLLKSKLIEDIFKALLGVFQDVYPQALLIEDLPGYRIRRHTDCAGKVISAQVYLPDDKGVESQGVTLQTLYGDKVKQIPYRFNHGYAFKVTNHSWHRVFPSALGRRSVQLIYYSTPDPKF